MAPKVLPLFLLQRCNSETPSSPTPPSPSLSQLSRTPALPLHGVTMVSRTCLWCLWALCIMCINLHTVCFSCTGTPVLCQQDMGMTLQRWESQTDGKKRNPSAIETPNTQEEDLVLPKRLIHCLSYRRRGQRVRRKRENVGKSRKHHEYTQPEK